MILNFSCKLTRAIFAGERVPRFVSIENVITRKLQQLDSAVTIDFLRRSPPGNRLELLSVKNVEIVDYY